MKRLCAILLAALALLPLSACGETGALEAQLQEAEAAAAEAEKVIAELESAVAESREALAAAESENDALEGEIGRLTLQLEESGRSDMLRYCICTETPDISACILSDGVFYMAPWLEAEQGAGTENGYAEVVLQAAVTDMVTGEESEWYLLRFRPISAPSSNIGWVPAGHVAEYTEENKTDISWPVALRDGAVVYKDRECSIVLEDDISWAEYFSVQSTVGGVACLGLSDYGSPLYVKTEDLAYPAA